MDNRVEELHHPDRKTWTEADVSEPNNIWKSTNQYFGVQCFKHAERSLSTNCYLDIDVQTQRNLGLCSISSDKVSKTSTAALTSFFSSICRYLLYTC